MDKVRYVFSPSLGKRVAAVTINPSQQSPTKRKHKSFKVDWVKLPAWVNVLRNASSPARLLAMIVLVEAFKREHVRGDIVLSSEITEIPQTARRRAVRELVNLGLITVEQIGNGAPIVTKVNKRQGATRGV